MLYTLNIAPPYLVGYIVYFHDPSTLARRKYQGKSVGDYYIRFAHGLSRRLRRFAQMATLLDVICGILWKSVGG